MTKSSPLGEVVTVHGVVRALAKSYRSTIKKSFMTVRKKKHEHEQKYLHFVYNSDISCNFNDIYGHHLIKSNLRGRFYKLIFIELI